MSRRSSCHRRESSKFSRLRLRTKATNWAITTPASVNAPVAHHGAVPMAAAYGLCACLILDAESSSDRSSPPLVASSCVCLCNTPAAKAKMPSLGNLRCRTAFHIRPMFAVFVLGIWEVVLLPYNHAKRTTLSSIKTISRLSNSNSGT